MAKNRGVLNVLSTGLGEQKCHWNEVWLCHVRRVQWPHITAMFVRWLEAESVFHSVLPKNAEMCVL